MKNSVDPCDGIRHQQLVARITFYEGEFGQRGEVLDVLPASGGQIVNYEDGVTALNQSVGYM
jgi:hypothetical protein